MRQQRTFQERNRYPTAEDLPVPPPVITKTIKHEGTTFVSEKEIIRLLLKFGSAEFERKIRSEDGKEEITTVSDYIVREIVSDDLMFDDNIFSLIFEEFKFATEQGIFIEDRQFIKHENPVISRLSAELLSDTHMLSPIWRDKQTFVETEDMKLKDIVPDSVLFFKGGKIKRRLDEIMIQMKEAQKSGDTESVLSLMKKDQNLKVALRMISEKLGNRIIL